MAKPTTDTAVLRARSLQRSAAADKSWANTDDWSARTKPARDARWQRLLDEVDPDGVLDPETRTKKAKKLQSARMKQLAAKSVASRAAKRRAS